VNERIREIGVRKAIGARRRDILWQFLVESTTLSAIGGALGIGTGAVLAWVIRSLTPLPTRVEPWSVGAALVLVVVVGILAGLGPALRASQLNPVEALRYE
jgi:putative ABC transport system permease protein